MRVNRSKSGLPTLTECGGGATNTGSVTLIADGDGNPAKPLFVPKGYSNGDHAIFVVKPGMTIVKAWRDRGGERVSVERITHIFPDDNGEQANEIVCAPVGEYENGDWNLPDSFERVVRIAIEKAHCYHCREAHFIASLE